MAAVQAGDILTSLVVDGIISGVGTIVTFLPNILILFLCLALLKDSGYMARVAYVIEGIMSRLGLFGKAFIPMLLGFAKAKLMAKMPTPRRTRKLPEKSKSRGGVTTLHKTKGGCQEDGR